MNLQFNKFDDIQHRPLKIYNRSVMFCNLFEDSGSYVAKEYADGFSPEERLEMAQMIALVKNRGPKFVKELVTKGVDFVDEPYVDG